MLLSIPRPDSGHRYHDIVLNDRASDGMRVHTDGSNTPVFNQLSSWQVSEYSAIGSRIQVPDILAEQALAELCGTRQWGGWRTGGLSGLSVPSADGEIAANIAGGLNSLVEDLRNHTSANQRIEGVHVGSEGAVGFDLSGNRADGIVGFAGEGAGLQRG